MRILLLVTFSVITSWGIYTLINYYFSNIQLINMADSGSKVGRLSPGDPSSYSRPEECMITDLELDIHVDFSRKVIHGTGTYKAKRMEVGAEVLVGHCFAVMFIVKCNIA